MQRESPFPHRIVDGAMPDQLVRAADAEWPSEDWPYWHSYRSGESMKLASRDPDRLPPACDELVRRMAEIRPDDDNCGAFPDLQLYGAGMHMMLPGCRLGRHLDAARHPLTGWRREYSMMLYLTPGWNRDWGGELCLHYDDWRVPVEPLFNRLVIFRCQENAWHSVAKVTGPEPRKALSLFFWSKSPDLEPRYASKFA